MIISNIINVLNPDVLAKYAQYKKYDIFRDTSKSFNLNIWAIRSVNQKAGNFDDLLMVFWPTTNGWKTLYIKCTVDPSDHYLLNPIHKLGTAIIKPGQHKSVWQLGMHKDYEALVQRRPITVIRDFNKDDIIDYTPRELRYLRKEVIGNNVGGNTIKYYAPDNEIVHIEDTGFFGIHLHRASKYNILEKIGLYSAGCVVVQDPKDYAELIAIIKSAEKNWGNSFTFTLVTEDTLIKWIRS